MKKLRPLAEADWGLVWANLPAGLCTELQRAMDELALTVPPPGVREFLAMLSANRLAAMMDHGSASDRFAAALEILGVDDDCDRDQRPADSVLRRLRRWQQADSDTGVRSSDEDAA